MRAKAIVEHRIRGRIRVRIPSKRRETSFFEAVVEKIRQHPGVHEANANPHTGSVVIHHSGDVDEILSLAVDLFELSDSDGANERLRAVADRSGLPLPELLDGMTVVSAGLAVYQLARRGDLGTASENFWAAFGSYRILKSPALTAAFAGLGIVKLLRGEVLGSATSLLYYSLMAHHIADEERKRDGSVKQSASERVAQDSPD